MFRISGFFDEVSGKLDEQIRFARSLGCRYLCPRGLDGKNIASYTRDAFVRDITPRLDAAGITFSSIGSPIGKIKLGDEAAYQKQLKQMEELIAIAELTGCRYIRIFSFYVDKNGDYAAAHPAVVEKLRGFLKLALGHDVVLLHENEKGIYGDTPERALALCREIDHPQFKLCYDASNYLQVGSDPWAAYESTKAQTVYYHMKDCLDGIEVPLGTGKGRIAEILADLAANRYDGFVTMEPHTAKYALLRKLCYALPFIDKKATAVYRETDRWRGITAAVKVTRADVFRWQYDNLVALIREGGGQYE